ncbi:hypothetical protein K9U40_13870 [Xanthobacter autotrophicus]|uniref:hypothetical protein n=1 Tax=Xanthobacter TaxID=279 RepID=UPI0024AC3A13|nr:hypothetical protein [Xanthobacter autotrophicus]MDI4665408.1 hypothetical protein [Xanthobacter autotrophicus]
MTNVVHLHAEPHVILEAGTIARANDPRDIGQRRYFLYHCEGGNRSCVWSGGDHAAALDALSRWRQDGLLGFDRTTPSASEGRA